MEALKHLKQFSESFPDCPRDEIVGVVDAALAAVAGGKEEAK